MEGMSVCLSGGADGADLLWGSIATALGHRVVHLSFVGHRSKADPRTLLVVPQDDLDAALPHLDLANRTLRRRVPRAGYVSSLLKRNYYQVVDSYALYAITGLDAFGLPTGGTAWAIQMFLDMGKRPAYLLDTGTLTWHERIGDVWEVMDAPPPEPSGRWTGIGTRKLPEGIADLIPWKREESDERS